MNAFNPSSLKPDTVHFLPLSGCAEFGAHCNVYLYNGRILIVDLGIGFPDEDAPGVNITLPDVSFLAENKDKIDGLVVTHSHEDHIGGIHYLWDRLQCPIFTTKHDSLVLKNKLAETDLKNVPITIVSGNGRFNAGTFEVELIPTAHSAPDSSMLLIGAGVESVLHSGDWKLDDKPVMGPKTDTERLIKLGNENLLALIGDSTNVVCEGVSISEGTLNEGFVEEFEQAKGRIFIACISSSMPRVKNIILAAEKVGRSVALVGRSMWTRYGIAKEMGYFAGVPDAVQYQEALEMADDTVIFIATGSQGEGRAALPRIVHGTHQHIRMKPSDTFFFSARVIPGNEKLIMAMQSAIMRAGCKLITPHKANIYASGHPCKEEMRQLYQWVKPHIAVPVHGDHPVISEHAKLARECNVPFIVVPNNGEVFELTREHGARVVANLQTVVLANDGNRLIEDVEGSQALRERRKMEEGGMASLSVLMTGGRVEQTSIDTMGLIDDENERERFHQKMLEQVEHTIMRMDHKKRLSDASVYEAGRVAIRRHIKQTLAKHPVITVHIHRM